MDARVGFAHEGKIIKVSKQEFFIAGCTLINEVELVSHERDGKFYSHLRVLILEYLQQQQQRQRHPKTSSSLVPAGHLLFF